MKKQLILSLFVGISFSALTQKYVDLANVYWRTSPYNIVEGSTEKRHFNLYGANLKYPKELNDTNLIILGLDYQLHSIIPADNYSGFSTLNLSSVALQFGFEHKWNSRFKTLFMIIPRLNSDLKQIAFDHFQIAGLVANTVSRSERFDWKYGLYYNTEFFGPMFVPFFGFDWRPSKKFNLKVNIPIHLEMGYRPVNWFRTGVLFRGVNASFHVQDPNYPLLNFDRYIDKADNNIWLFTEFHLFKNIWSQIRAGYSVFRRYRWFLEDDKLAAKIGPINVGDDRLTNIDLFENGWSFEGRLLFRLPLED